MSKAASGDAIWVGQGDYNYSGGVGFVLKHGVSLYGGFQGVPSETLLEQRKPRLYKARVLGKKATQSPLVQVQRGPETVSFGVDGFEIVKAGRAIEVQLLTPNSIFQALNNTSLDNGTAVYAYLQSPG